MPLDLAQNNGPIDQDDPIFADFLEDLQGNILNGHGRDYAIHLFIAFDDSQIAQVKAWIANLAKTQITSAKAQLDGTAEFKRNGTDAGLFSHFALSSSGYERLGIGKDGQPTGPNPRNRPPDIGGNPFYAKSFQDGMKNRQAALLDPPADEWDVEFQSMIDALVILADDDAAKLVAEELKILDQLKDIATVVNTERGFTLRRKFETVDPTNPSNQFGTVVEHFGYADGVSQPIFLRKQYYREREKVGVDFWDPAAPLKLVLIRDPLGSTPGVSFGSFLVFRKLEQNVKGFKEAEAKLAEALKLPEELAGALAVGRYEDGSPVVLQPLDGAWATPEKPSIPNDFNYKGDPKGLSCPFQAHIRKTNPRLESVGSFAQSEEEELGHRIARRGITYGGPLSTEEFPSKGVGLLFMCYQSDIWEQFEFIQRLWANNFKFVKSGDPNYDVTGLDAVIGQKRGDQFDPIVDPAQAPNPPQNWPREWGKSTIKPDIPPENQFGQFVTLKGGEYFFAPSLSFLKGLA